MHYVGGGGKCFDQNDNQDPQVMLNCTTFDNIKGFSMASGSTGHTIKNCIAFKATDKMISDQSQNITQNNSWQFGSTTSDKQNGGIGSYADFVADMSNNSTANQLASVARNADGSIPDNGFCRLLPSSDCIDKGQVVNYTFRDLVYPIGFNGSAPDLGAFEYKAPTGFHHHETNYSELKISGNSDLSTISFHLEKSCPVHLKIMDISGKTVLNCIENQLLPEGNNFHVAYLGNLPQGNYLLKLEIENNSQTIKFIR